MQTDSFTVDSGAVRVRFDKSHGVFPAQVALRNYDGEYENVLQEGSGLTLVMPDGKKLHPCAGAFTKVEKHGEVDRVIFQEISFQDDSGHAEEGFRGYMTYEFYPDGTMFSNIFFYVTSHPVPHVKDLKIVLAADTKAFDDVRWAYLHRRNKLDATVIQDLSPKRFLPRGEELTFQEISPAISFNCFRKGAETRYMEFFMEGGTTLSGKPFENQTSVKWQEGNPAVEWNFQTVPVTEEKLSIQFRNYWGWIVKNADLTRQKPPFVMYHVQDKDKRYPSKDELEAMKDSGCTVVTIHEKWRYDVQNGGVPFDEKRFTDMVKEAHDLGLRVTVYMRGNENATVEDLCEWFDRYLVRNHDGLYMDYGGPFNFATAPNEDLVNGRVHFRQHYQLHCAIRKMLGPDGLYFSHTGPSYSGMSMSKFDGYVSGEGERGLLIRSRKHHEYFSMAAVTCGTMWTSAFPEYHSERMTPFLAAAGQYPHSPLGPATNSSSLTHPSEPGINDRAVRPLWKLWGMVKNERNLQVRNDFNCRKVFVPDEECGHYLMITSDGSKALYIISNFAQESRTFDVTPAWERSGFSPAGKKCFLLTPNIESPGTPQPYEAPKLSVTLKANGVAAFYFASGEPDFSEYTRPYHKVCGAGLRYLAEIEEQRKLRNNPPKWEKTILTAGTPKAKYGFGGYEDSLIRDIWVNDSYLVKFAPDGSFTKIKKLVREDGKSLFSGDRTPPIVLNELLPPGEHDLGLYATSKGEPFYLFFDAQLSNGKGESYTLLYRNDLEADRAFLHFKVKL
ncbi:MAG: hypothetical protein J6A21_07650 [Lentisphaeria bacterium]|nr:hypothetical protein [Lentisphaeria bacterium]